MSRIPQSNNIPADYTDLLQLAVTEIRTAREVIAKQINSSANSVYWNLGKLLFDKQLEEGYGSGVVKQLSVDLKHEFPDMGLSPRNLWDMKRFYERYSEADTKLRQLVAVLPWGHNLLLVNKVKEDSEVAFYASETLTKGWSRDLLLNAIKMDSFGQAQKQLKANNFEQTLPETHAEYANEVFRSTYNLGFLSITERVKELELENRLIAKIRAFILELGKGFSFIGNQYRLEYNGKEYFVDMLFFHRGLQSLVAIELNNLCAVAYWRI
ncbi:putative nuclease of restriction endonuclease-like (RecB) superfamily [Algoriphagus ratkowskyi]|uniref:Putative nuclease of restriction endonuclease-like (RecB) superfamily n=1 Tax=Algoriphagus ratkowskyi TaxID=57028 RepID=A0A2W7RLJ3_9BACT|nr:PDDEXK nuclease domain-containing protein [Algoriphagus ratkowskyi]PZX59370.1 putative nuclease of restriction endonuclease-like (RecB) superfamily [Algoriphagus ratkowskyi]